VTNKKKVLAVITARGGSKGLPGKNVKELAGKPLIAWTIEAANKSKYIDHLILSSEDSDIIDVSKEWGCNVPFVRPLKLAQDDNVSIEVLLHAIDQVDYYDYVVLLQPTSPLRTCDDIDGCIELCLKKKANVAVSVTEQEKSPYWMFNVDAKTSKMAPLMGREIVGRRQELPKVYSLNGAVYFVKCDWLKVNRTFFSPETIAYEMPKERSFDIDTELDFRICEYFLKG
jgi:CMP-N,N'-diacetyllegionaminic acid synthase